VSGKLTPEQKAAKAVLDTFYFGPNAQAGPTMIDAVAEAIREAVRPHKALVRRLKAAIRDIDAHATPCGLLNESDPDGGPAFYQVTPGALHRALGVAADDVIERDSK
jgi:hypothetical protein